MIHVDEEEPSGGQNYIQQFYVICVQIWEQNDCIVLSEEDCTVVKCEIYTEQNRLSPTLCLSVFISQRPDNL